MTIASAFNDIAVAQGGTPNYSGTIAAAIDALNDALAGSDQQAASTIEEAVRLLGQHIGGGGGGSFGALQFVGTADGVPVVGGEFLANPYTISLRAGGTVYADSGPNFTNAFITSPVAAGLTAVVFAGMDFTECDAYVCAVDENYQYSSVEPWDGEVEIGSIEGGGMTCTLTVPELDFDLETFTGEILVLHVH